MKIHSKVIHILMILLTSMIAQGQTQAQRDDAKWILERITGVKWASSSPVLKEAYTLAAEGKRTEIAALAVKQKQFLNVTVRNFGLKMSTREETVRIPLNDFAATIMGVTRDDIDARELLYGNFFYMGDANLINDVDIFSRVVIRSNEHYDRLEDRRNDVGSMLVKIQPQRVIVSYVGNNNGYVLAPNPDPAGLLTTRTWMFAHLNAGTNRRPVEYTFREFMCVPIEKWADAAAADVRIGRDIDRFPGGDHLKFQTSCKACHNVMDGFRGAFGKWAYAIEYPVHTTYRPDDVNIHIDENGIWKKMNQNSHVYPGGYTMTDDTWVNNAIRGSNVGLFGWRGTDGNGAVSSGKGLNSFGRLIANSKRFSTCMAKRVFETVCRKQLTEADIQVFQDMGVQFESTNYNLKKLFQTAALNPKCK